MKNKKRIIIITIVIIIGLLFTAGLSRYRRGIVDSSSSFKKIIEYLGSTYIKVEKSSEEGYAKDIYITYSSDPVVIDVGSMQYVYDNMAVALARKMKNKDFRIIDEERNIIQRVNFEDDGTFTYVINNDENYFKNKFNEIQIKGREDSKLEKIDIEVLSNELKTIMQLKWDEKQVKGIGTFEKKDKDYYIYKEGYKIRYLNGKVFNIVFGINYKNDVVKLSNTKDKEENILNVQFKNDDLKKGIRENAEFMSSQNNALYGWKGSDIYVFNRDNQISIYPVQVYDNVDNTKFVELVDKLSEDGNVRNFVDKLTDIYGDFTKYESEDNKIMIDYPLRGIEITYNITRENGIVLYNNYYDMNKYNLEYFKNNSSKHENIYLNLDEDLICKYEKERNKN